MLRENQMWKSLLKVEYIYEDTRATTGVDPVYKWGEIYLMIANQNMLDAGFEEPTIYANIEKSALMKVPLDLSCSHAAK